MNYVQCLLEKKLPNEAKQTSVSWIPQEFAKKGKKLELLKNDVWECGWTVIETYAVKDEKYVLLKERDHLKQREASDV